MTATTTAPASGRAGTAPAAAAARRSARGYASGKDDYLTRLRKIEGQVRGLQKMIDAGTWCPDVVTQIASVTRALQEVAVGLPGRSSQHHPPGDAAVLGRHITEQAPVVDVRGFGLVLISGCGPPIEQILGITEHVLDVPIRAVVGDRYRTLRAGEELRISDRAHGDTDAIKTSPDAGDQ